MTNPKIVLKTTDIHWSIDIEDGYEKLDEMTAEAAADALGVPKDTYTNMTTGEKHDYAYDEWHHSHASLYEFVDAPDEVVIPNPMNKDWDDDTVSDYISNETGWCHESFSITCNLSIEQLQSIPGTEHIIAMINKNKE